MPVDTGRYWLTAARPAVLREANVTRLPGMVRPGREDSRWRFPERGSEQRAPGLAAEGDMAEAEAEAEAEGMGLQRELLKLPSSCSVPVPPALAVQTRVVGFSLSFFLFLSLSLSFPPRSLGPSPPPSPPLSLVGPASQCKAIAPRCPRRHVALSSTRPRRCARRHAAPPLIRVRPRTGPLPGAKDSRAANPKQSF